MTAFPLVPPTASEGDARPDAFVLGTAYPNPVGSGGVTVLFSLERAAEVRLVRLWVDGQVETRRVTVVR